MQIKNKVPWVLLCSIFISNCLQAEVQIRAENQGENHSKNQSDTVEDPYLWLEDVDGDRAMQWVEANNLATSKSLASTPLFDAIYADALAALNSKDKLPEVELIGDSIYTLKKNQAHPRGIYQRTSLASFKAGKPSWQTVLDIDAMSTADNVKWVFHGMDCYAPDNIKCLVYLSPGGGDADIMREFDAHSLKFVNGGFELPKAKMNVAWQDENHLFVGTDFGEGTLTESGYPRQIKVWQRGTPLSKAKTVLEVAPESVSSFGLRRGSGDHAIDVLTDSLSYWTRQYYQLVDKEAVPLKLPNSAIINDMIDGYLVVSLIDDWSLNGHKYKQGSVLLIKPSDLLGELNEKASPSLLVESSSSAIVEDVTVTKHSILVTILEDVKSRVDRYQKIDGSWVASRVDLPASGQILIETVDDESGEFFARYEGFLTPPSLYSVDADLNTKVVLQQSSTFDSADMKVEQYFVESADGTRVPYFVVMNEKTKFDGTNPTHIFAYGGFRASLTPSYSGSYEPHNGAYGKAWLERGGVFVLANIRGGGEYGPAWHASVLKQNRYKAFEDFEAIAQDLVERKITSPQHLGIEGRSNGGLLVGATMVRMPELYGAILCGVPLLDMQRYNKLLAGASWMAEYGNPDTSDWEYIQAYSPYQKVDKNAEYPPIFFFTSTRDDRVHPAHARKMAALMKVQGHRVDYFENTEGGHKGSATAEQTARRIALSFTHLWQHLK